MSKQNHVTKHLAAFLFGAASKRARARKRPEGQPVMPSIDALEQRVFLSVSVSQIGVFNGTTDGGAPIEIVTDSSGDVFGVAVSNGATDSNGLGEVFEIPVNSDSVRVLYRFTGMLDGGTPTSLVIDSNNNLFGATKTGGPNGEGTIFEIQAGGSTPTTLAPTGNIKLVAVDSSDDLFGYNANGVFELQAGMQTLTQLSDQFGGSLVLGADGNLYGTQSGGGANGTGDVFEVDLANDTTTTLASFDASGDTGMNPIGVAADANGNVFGVAKEGGMGNSGTIFEITKGSGAVTPLDYLDNNSTSVGGTPIAAPIMDSAGNLYGLNFDGGANQLGALWELPDGSGPATEGGTQPALDLAGISTADEIGGIADLVGAIADKVDPQNPQIDVSNQFDGHTPPKNDGLVIAVGGAGGGGGGGGGDGSIQDALKKAEQDEKDAEKDIEDDKKDLKDDLQKGKDAQQIKMDLDRLNDDQDTLDDVETRMREIITIQSQSANVTSQFNSEATTINNLDAQLTADQGNPAKLAGIQKKIDADNAIQAKRSAQITADQNAEQAGLNVVNSDLATVDTSLTSIAADLASLPPATVTLSGTITSTPASVAAGKKASVVVSVTNSGNETASGPLQVAFSARPAGTDGSADIVLPTAKVSIHILPGKSGNEHLSFLVPKSLPTGTYSLVAQLDPNNTFGESALPGVIVGLQTFTVT